MRNFLALEIFADKKAAGKLVIEYWTIPIIYYQKQKSQLETDFAVLIQLTMGYELHHTARSV
ncbi:hypothetical protein [Nostoc foliaceum]|uniref:Transposase n=1 Tax=Nostoc linckia FACHB-391 TaxID=2692906 RepID=A0ABR8EYR7_NOSLI|nr:hypothetical protein [Nostoc foliaceum]MBD2562977.1 hypothetical protein [Nostoc linckia FACHB-391]